MYSLSVRPENVAHHQSCTGIARKVKSLDYIFVTEYLDLASTTVT